MTISRNMCCIHVVNGSLSVALHFCWNMEHVFGNTVDVISVHVIWIQWGLYVSLLYGICVCSTQGINEIDRMVYCLGVVTFLGDSGVKRAEITDCSSRMDPLLDRIYQCFCCSILARRDKDFSTTSSFNAAKYRMSFYVVSSAMFSIPELALIYFQSFRILRFFLFFDCQVMSGICIDM